MATMNISLPDTMRELVEAQVQTGEYANASDYVRALIREDLRQREAIRLALMEGERSGTSSRKLHDIAAAAKASLKHG